MIFPVVLGGGGRLFAETSAMKPMRLIAARTVGDGLAFLAYEPGQVRPLRAVPGRVAQWTAGMIC